VAAGSNGSEAVYAPQCSANGEFCYWCEFRENPDPNEECPCTELKAMTRILVEGRKELPVIVAAIREIYNSEIRQQVVYRNRITGLVQSAPEWSDLSIQKHLIFSSEFPECADLVVHHVHMSMLMNLNRSMICTKTGEVRENTRKAFIETVASLSRWRKNTGLCSESGAGKGK
jgi:hypothetical protein